jgi:hypothetical protein
METIRVYSEKDLERRGGIDALAREVENSTSVRELHISCCELDVADARRLATAVGKSKSMERLLLFSTLTGDEGVAALAVGLETSTSLRNLQLRSNRIGNAGAATLARVVENSTQIVKLELDGNAIGEAGVLSLAGAVQKNASLLELSLSSCKIGNSGAAALAKAVMGSNSLQGLDLGHCVIGDKGALALAEAVGESKSLQKLRLSGNCITAAGANALASGVARSAHVVHVDLFEFERVIAEAKRFRPERWELLTFMAGGEAPRTLAVRRFLERDGDHAIMTMVLQFMFPRPFEPWNPPARVRVQSPDISNVDESQYVPRHHRYELLSVPQLILRPRFAAEALAGFHGQLIDRVDRPPQLLADVAFNAPPALRGAARVVNATSERSFAARHAMEMQGLTDVVHGAIAEDVMYGLTHAHDAEPVGRIVRTEVVNRAQRRAAARAERKAAKKAGRAKA